MPTVVPLRARSPWSVVPALVVALVLAGAVAACCLAIVFGVGVQQAPAWNPWLLAIAVGAFAPVPWLVLRWRVLRPPARLVVEGDTVTIAYPELLRTPFAVPHALVRAAAVEDEGRDRFRVHDGYLWSRGASALPVLVPDGVRPNVLLVFEEPVPGADVRRSRLAALFRGEHVAALMVAARDASAARQALVALGLVRPLTMPDVLRLEEQLTADGGRFALMGTHLVRIGWALIVVGVLAPIVAAIAAVLGGLLIYGGRRAHGAALAIAGLGVFGARLALWLG